MEGFDRLKDGPVNNFVGTMSLTENLKAVPENLLDEVKPVDLREEVIFKDMKNVRQSEDAAVPWQLRTSTIFQSLSP